MSDLTSRLAEPAYVRHQYADDERLRIRIETHERFSENKTPFVGWVLERVGAVPGQQLLDVGSGPGQYHAALRGIRVVSLDLSLGMLERARGARVQADAQALPFADGSFDRVMANHVLYHLSDMGRGLRELRRVARPGARVVIATNSRTTMRPLWQITDEIAADLRSPSYRTVALRFGLEDVDLVRGVFPDVRVDVYEDAFLFTDAEPVLAYVSSMWVDFASPEVRSQFLERLDRRVTALIDRDGVFRVPKTGGCFVADL